MAEAAVPGAHTRGRSRKLKEELLTGLVAGQLAGLVMVAFVMVVSVMDLHKHPLFPGQVIGSALIGESGLVGLHLPAAVVGFLFHQLGPSLIWGAVFGVMLWAFDGRRGGRLPVLALQIGLLSQLIGVYLVLPSLFRGLRGHDTWNEQFPMFWSWVANLVFCLSLLIWPMVQESRRLAREHRAVTVTKRAVPRA